MKKKSSISFGPGAASLILIFVVLSMSVLGMLSLMNSRSDVRLSERSVQVTEAVYALNAQAEEKFVQLQETLQKLADSSENEEAYQSSIPESVEEDMDWEDGILSFTVSDGFRTLDCAVQVNSLEENTRCRWVRHNLTAETEEVW